jgi:hypothetical protein
MSDTESDSEEVEEFLQDDEVFIGVVSIAEQRASKLIGGCRRTTVVVDRESVLGLIDDLDNFSSEPFPFEEDIQPDLNNQDYLEPIITLQSWVRQYRATKNLAKLRTKYNNRLQNEERARLLRIFATELVSGLLDNVHLATRSTTHQQAVTCMNSLIPKWKSYHEEKQIQAAKENLAKQPLQSPKQTPLKSPISQMPPVKRIPRKSSIVRRTTDKVNVHRNARLQLQKQLEQMPKPIEKPAAKSTKSVDEFLADKTAFLQNIEQKRIALREKKLAQYSHLRKAAPIGV